MEPETINSTELRTKTRDLMERVKYNREIFLVETFGRPMAVIMSVEDFDLLKRVLPTGADHKSKSMKKNPAKGEKMRRKIHKVKNVPEAQVD